MKQGVGAIDPGGSSAVLAAGVRRPRREAGKPVACTRHEAMAGLHLCSPAHHTHPADAIRAGATELAGLAVADLVAGAVTARAAHGADGVGLRSRGRRCKVGGAGLGSCWALRRAMRSGGTASSWRLAALGACSQRQAFGPVRPSTHVNTPPVPGGAGVGAVAGAAEGAGALGDAVPQAASRRGEPGRGGFEAGWGALCLGRPCHSLLPLCL